MIQTIVNIAHLHSGMRSERVRSWSGEGEAIKSYLIAHKFQKSSRKILVNAGMDEREGGEKGRERRLRNFLLRFFNIDSSFMTVNGRCYGKKSAAK